MSPLTKIVLISSAILSIMWLGAFVVSWVFFGLGTSGFYVSLVLIGLGVPLLMVWLVALSNRDADRIAQQMRQIMAMPVAAAKSRAEALLLNPDLFECTAAESKPPRLERFGPTVQEFFARRTVVVQVGSNLTLDVRNPTAAKVPGSDRAAFQIGTNDHSEILLVEGSDEVLDVFEETGEKPDVTVYPTIYHFILSTEDTSDTKPGVL